MTHATCLSTKLLRKDRLVLKNHRNLRKLFLFYVGDFLSMFT